MIQSPACPCGSRQSYAACCELYHRGVAVAPTAEVLMRSRYSAYTLNLREYLLATWHASTRPSSLNLASTHTRWLGLKVMRSENIDATHARVEFTARFREGGGPAQRLHEDSRFVFESGHWFYVDGDIA